MNLKKDPKKGLKKIRKKTRGHPSFWTSFFMSNWGRDDARPSTSQSLRSPLLKIQNEIYKLVPMAKAMGVELKTIDLVEGTQLHLPLKPNRNHLGTTFGGSLVAAQALGCWVMLRSLLLNQNMNVEIVVFKQSSVFLSPVKNDCSIVIKPPTEKDLNRFLSILKNHSKARITMTAQALAKGLPACTFEAEYVAIRT